MKYIGKLKFTYAATSQTCIIYQHMEATYVISDFLHCKSEKIFHDVIMLVKIDLHILFKIYIIYNIF